MATYIGEINLWLAAGAEKLGQEGDRKHVYGIIVAIFMQWFLPIALVATISCTI